MFDFSIQRFRRLQFFFEIEEKKSCLMKNKSLLSKNDNSSQVAAQSVRQAALPNPVASSKPDTSPIECYHSRGQQPCKFIRTKENVYSRKEFNSHSRQHGRCFTVLGKNMADLM